MAPELVGDALKSIFTSKAAMLSMLLYAAVFVTESALNKFLDELDRKNSGSDVDLSEEDKKSVRHRARTEDYKRFGIDDDIAKDLGAGVSVESVKKKYNLSGAEASNLDKKLGQHSAANAMRLGEIDPNAANSLAKGKSFDDVAKDMGWSEDAKNRIRGKLENVAKQNGGLLTDIADNAYKSGLTPDQKIAYDMLKGDSNVPRATLRSLIAAPKDFDTITKDLSADTKDELRTEIRARAEKHGSNNSLQDLYKYSTPSWLHGLNKDQTSVAIALNERLKKISAISDPSDRHAISASFAKAGLDRKFVNDAAETLKQNWSSLSDIFKIIKVNIALVLLAAVPLFIAIAKGDSKAIKEQSANLMTSVALEAVFALAGGPGALAGAIFMMSALAAPFFEKKLQKDPWVVTEAYFAIAAMPLVSKLIQNKISQFFKNIFGSGPKNRTIVFTGMTQQQVASLVYSDVYDDHFKKSGNHEIASMAMMAMLLKDNVLSAEGLKEGVNRADFDITKARLAIENIPSRKWSNAIAEYTVNAVTQNNVEKYYASELLAGVINAFNNIETKAGGLGAYSGQQIQPWIFALEGPSGEISKTAVERGINYRNGKSLQELIRDTFNLGFEKNVFTTQGGKLDLNFTRIRHFSDIAISAIHYASGSHDEFYDYMELAKAFDILNAGETHAKSEQRQDHLRAVVRYYGAGEYISKISLQAAIRQGQLKSTSGSTWIDCSWQNATVLDLDFDWASIWARPDRGSIVHSIVLKSGETIKDASSSFRDVELGEWLVNLGMLPGDSRGDDAKDIAKFLIRAIDKNADLGSADPSVLTDLITQGVIAPPKQGSPIALDLSKLSPYQIADSLHSLSESRDAVMGIEDLLKAFNYVLPGKPFEKIYGIWGYSSSQQANVWFRASNDAAKDLSEWIGATMGGTHANYAGGEWRFETLCNFRAAIELGFFKNLLDARYREASLESLKPVVLDLTGKGLSFSNLATSSAQYDSNNDGTRETLAWASSGTGILSYDIDGDNIIQRTNEIAFTSYKVGAKTDLEGLTAFDTNGNGKLDAGDTSWKKFGVWIDADEDGVSDAGEFKSLDEVGISSIGLVSDKVERRLDGVTVHGLSTYTTNTGKTGTVGDVSFDVSRTALSAAEIARRRDLLAQAVASSATTKSASTGLRASGADLTINLNLFASKT